MPQKEFLTDPLYYPFSDASFGGQYMHFEMMISPEIQILLDEKYRLLANLESKNIYGQPSAGAFTDALVDYIHEHGRGSLQIIGEPVSGKSFSASQWAGLLKDIGIQPIYVPWVDVIRDARRPEIGLIDETREFGELTPEEFRRTTDFYYAISDALLSQDGDPFCVIGEVPGIPVVYDIDPYTRVPLDRGTTAIRKLTQKYGAFVAALYSSPGVRAEGKRFRQELAVAKSPDQVIELMDEYDIQVKETEPEKIENELKKSGAPAHVVSKIEDQVTQTIIHLANLGMITIHPFQRNPEYLRDHPKVRTRIIGEQLLPFLLDGDGNADFDVPAERSFIGFNKKVRGGEKLARFDLSTVHYRNFLDVSLCASSAEDPNPS